MDNGAPAPCVTLDPLTTQQFVSAMNRSVQITSDSFDFVTNMARQNWLRTLDVAQAIGYRIVTESGDGQTRSLGNLVAPKVGA